jgi:exonuclease III
MHCKSANDGATENGVFVAAKNEFATASETPDRQSAGTLMRVEFDGWTLLACYFPQKAAKARYFEVCRRIAQDRETRPLLIVGDLNTGNQMADRTPAGTPYFCSDDFDDLSRKHGLCDLWRRTNGDKQDWTWRSSPKRNPFRLDHAFGNRLFVDSFNPSCRYDHSPREATPKSSDHSAIIVTTEPLSPGNA